MQNTQNTVSVHHSFDVDLAAELKSIDLAVLIHHFQFWIRHNGAMNNNFHDERTWTYQKLKDIAAHFPYWSIKQVERLINKLVELEILIKGNYNKSAYDRTTWYAFKNEERFAISRNREKELPKSGNRTPEIGTPIPDTKPYILTNTNTPYSPSNSEKKESKTKTPNGGVCVSVSDEAKVLTTETIKVMRQQKPTCSVPTKLEPWHEAAQVLLDRGLKTPEIIKVLHWALRDNTIRGDWKGWASPLWRSKNKLQYLDDRFDSIETQMTTKSVRTFAPCSDDNEAASALKNMRTIKAWS